MQNIYKEMYLHLFNAVSDALALLEGGGAAQAEALMDLSLGKARFLLEGGSLEDSRGMAQSQLPHLTPDMLLRESPLRAPSLLELVQEVEDTIAGKQ